MATPISQRETWPRAAVLGAVGGIFILIFFGAYWGCTSAFFLSGVFQIAAFLLVGLVTIGCFGLNWLLLRASRVLPEDQLSEDAPTRRSIQRRFGFIFGLEIVLIALAGILLSHFQLTPFITPTIALIVGVHFFPLAQLFRVSAYFLTGVLLALIALVGLGALLLGLPIAGPSPYNWSLFVGIGATLILWCTVLYMIWFVGRMVWQRGDRQRR